MLQRTPNAARLGAFWFGIQVVWGALLGVSLQSRASQLSPHEAIGAFSMLASIGAAAAALTQIIAGVISDERRRRGSRRLEFYAGGTIVAAAALYWFYSAASYAQLLAAVILVQIGMNLAIGPYQAAIPDFLSGDRVTAASSWMAAMQSIGNAAGAVLAGTVAQLRVVALAVIAALAASCVVTAAHVRHLHLLPAAPERVRVTRAFADLFVSRAFVWLGFYTLLDYFYFLMQHTVGGNVRYLTGLMLVVVTAFGALGAIAAARVAAMDRRLLANIGGFAFAFALVMLVVFAHSLTSIALTAAFAGAAWGVFLTADWALGCGVLPRHLLATSMAVWNLAVIVPQSVAPAIAARTLTLMHRLHDPAAPRIAFLLAVAEVLAGILWIWRVPAYSGSVNAPLGGNTA
jgi:MFS family permease